MRSVAEIREGIARNSRRIRRKAILEQIEVLTNIYGALDSEKDSRKISKNDIERVLVLDDIMRIKDEKLLNSIKWFIQGCTRK